MRCFRDGCYAKVILEKPLLDTLKTSTSATFIVFQTPEDAFTADQANEWNNKYRWIKAYSGDGSNFKMDVSFIGGITKANLEGTVLDLGFADQRYQGFREPEVARP